MLDSISILKELRSAGCVFSDDIRRIRPNTLRMCHLSDHRHAHEYDPPEMTNHIQYLPSGSWYADSIHINYFARHKSLGERLYSPSHSISFYRPL